MTPIEFVSATGNEGMFSQRVAQSLRPIYQGRKGDSGWRSQPNYSRRRKSFALDNGIGEVCGAQHDRIDLVWLNPRLRLHLPHCRKDATGHIGSGRRFGRGNHVQSVHQHGVGVCPTHVNSDSHNLLSLVNYSIKTILLSGIQPTGTLAPTGNISRSLMLCDSATSRKSPGSFIS